MSLRAKNRLAIASIIQAGCLSALCAAYNPLSDASLAQDCTPCGPAKPVATYRLQTETVYEQVPVTRN